MNFLVKPVCRNCSCQPQKMKWQTLMLNGPSLIQAFQADPNLDGTRQGNFQSWGCQTSALLWVQAMLER